MDSPAEHSEKVDKSRSMTFYTREVQPTALHEEAQIGGRSKNAVSGQEHTTAQNLESPSLAKRPSLTEDEEPLALKLYYESLRRGKYVRAAAHWHGGGRADARVLFDKRAHEHDSGVRALLELPSDDELDEARAANYLSALALGFSAKQVKRESNLLNVHKMPPMSLSFYDIDYGRAMRDNERQLRSQKTAPKRANAPGGDNVSVETRAVKPKKGEVPIVFTPVS